MIFVKNFKPEKLISVMSLALFALLLAEAYLNHKDDIDGSVSRLKSVLNDNGQKPEETAEFVETTAEVSEGVTENAE